MQLLSKELEIPYTFPEQHWMAAWTLWVWSDGRSWATWGARGCHQDPCPPCPPLPTLEHQVLPSPPAPVHPWCLPEPCQHIKVYVQTHVKSGCNLHIPLPAVFFSIGGFVPKFNEAKPLTMMPIPLLNQCKGTGIHRVEKGRQKDTYAPWTASH